MKKFITSILLATCLVSTIPVLAEETKPNEVYYNTASDGTTSYTTGESECTVEVIEFEPNSYLVATVPMEIPVVVDTAGNITIPDNLEIENNSDQSIRLTSTTITAADEFYVASVSSNALSSTEEKVFSMRMNSANISGTSAKTTTSTLQLGFEIKASETYPMDFEIKFSPAVYQTASEKVDFATISYTIALA